jgi:hypothetical protein
MDYNNPEFMLLICLGMSIGIMFIIFATFILIHNCFMCSYTSTHVSRNPRKEVYK